MKTTNETLSGHKSIFVTALLGSTLLHAAVLTGTQGWLPCIEAQCLPKPPNHPVTHVYLRQSDASASSTPAIPHQESAIDKNDAVKVQDPEVTRIHTMSVTRRLRPASTPTPASPVVARQNAKISQSIATAPDSEADPPAIIPELQKPVTDASPQVASNAREDLPPSDTSSSSVQVRTARIQTIATPAYPATSRRRGEEGRVLVKVDLDAQGHVTATTIVESSGYSRLDEAAQKAALGSTYQSAIANGVAVASSTTLPFMFKLN